MPVVDFTEAREMVGKFQEWLDAVSQFLDKPSGNPPPNFYNSQKLSFELYKDELEVLMSKERVVGIFCLEPDVTSFSVLLVGVNAEGRPETAIKSRQTWPMLNTMMEVQEVLNTYLTPEN